MDATSATMDTETAPRRRWYKLHHTETHRATAGHKVLVRIKPEWMSRDADVPSDAIRFARYVESLNQWRFEGGNNDASDMIEEWAEIEPEGVRRSHQEIIDLKAQWVTDGCWDIEDTEGFEAHRDELHLWRLEFELKLEREAHRKLRQALQTIVFAVLPPANKE